MGTVLVTADRAGNIHLHRVSLGPTQAQIDKIVRLEREEQRRRGVPTKLEVRAQGLGEKLLSFAIAAGLENGDSAEIDGRVYRIVVKHNRNIDDVSERVATAQIETGTHEVLARGGGLVIQPDRVAPEVVQQFFDDFPAISQLLVRKAAEKFIDEHEAKSTGFRKVKVAAHEVGHALVENHVSMLLALAGVGLTIAIPPLAIMGVPWEIEAALGGIASLVAHDAKGALSDDMDRRSQAALVRQHFDIIGRAQAIQSFDVWAHDLGKARVLPKVHVVPVARLPLAVNAGAAPARVMALA